jgi:NAD(P)-dependent dehydrogenase (short-subunit alcohol dehydrogenase family)
MASRGAKHLILLSRFGPRTEAAIKLIEDLRLTGVQVEVSPCDVTSLEALKATISSCASTMPSIKGCIQGSMVLKVRCYLVIEKFVDVG